MKQSQQLLQTFGALFVYLFGEGNYINEKELKSDCSSLHYAQNWHNANQHANRKLRLVLNEITHF